MGLEKVAQDTYFTFLNTTKTSVNPETIEVNKKNAAFAVETSPIICYDSMVQFIDARLTFAYTKVAQTSDSIQGMIINYMPVYGAFGDNWTSTDTSTGLSPLTVLELAKDDTDEAIRPLWDGSDLGFGGNHPLSNVVFPTDAFGDWGLTTNATQERVSFTRDILKDSQQYYTNSAKIATLHGRFGSVYLSPNHTSHSIRLPRIVPRHVQFGNEYLFYGMLVSLPPSGATLEQIPHSTDTTDINHVWIKSEIRFNEWNPDFEQARM